MTTSITAESSIVRQTRDLLNAVRGSLIKVAQNLYEIKTNGSFAEKGSWGSFCESELGISESFASKLLTVNRVYILEGGMEPAQLEGIDYERLYLATKTDGPIELKLETARTLTRSQIKQTKAEHDGHTPHFGEYCDAPNCWLPRASHP